MPVARAESKDNTFSGERASCFMILLVFGQSDVRQQPTVIPIITITIIIINCKKTLPPPTKNKQTTNNPHNTPTHTHTQIKAREKKSGTDHFRWNSICRELHPY